MHGGAGVHPSNGRKRALNVGRVHGRQHLARALAHRVVRHVKFRGILLADHNSIGHVAHPPRQPSSVRTTHLSHRGSLCYSALCSDAFFRSLLCFS